MVSPLADLLACAKPTRSPHPRSIRFRDALGKQREESGYATQPWISCSPRAFLDRLKAGKPAVCGLHHSAPSGFPILVLGRTAPHIGDGIYAIALQLLEPLPRGRGTDHA
ncbi:hypothetical protein [Streptomyces bauhiniae]|uniref:Uncharacterized protein n=1 Tax=Streptomyces bauhiniae TaxID=2340725 RepID=A0A7K3QTK5_9ACTN|nr:hypothetical protein [Streptomyces bauhiniae]NEB93183.1 hypothetical protein [Streptomyces bauhiniae]